MAELYSTVTESRTGVKIPVFVSGKPMNSKYDPEREAENQLKSIPSSSFYIVPGIGSGLLVSRLLERDRNSFFYIIENSKKDIEFLRKNFPSVNNFFSSQNFFFTDKEEISRTLPGCFIPARFPSLSFVETRSWNIECGPDYEKIKASVQKSLKTVSADYSVQCHFGKIWQKNILENLKLVRNQEILLPVNNKTAVIVAAGPSLDKKIRWLRENQKSLYIIATDTAGSTLKKENIFCDAVCSLDGQNISTRHFSHKIDPETLYIFDLQANHNAAKKIVSAGAKLLYTQSGHPLSQYAQISQKNNCFTTLNAGTGTVTIQALDFAIKAGFKKISVIGADFSYPDNKAYTSGTYLDSIYGEKSIRIRNEETEYSRLMYRTELIENDGTKTTEILDSYRKSFIEWLKLQGCDFLYSQNTYNIHIKPSENKLLQNNFDQELFKSALQNDITSYRKTGKCPSNLETALLPYIAALNLQNSSENKPFSYEENLKLALQNIVRYT